MSSDSLGLVERCACVSTSDKTMWTVLNSGYDHDCYDLDDDGDQNHDSLGCEDDDDDGDD